MKTLQNPEDVPSIVQPYLQDRIDRALKAGAKPPLTYLGAGMFGVVFCDRRGHSFKVYRSLEDAMEEGEWLEVAERVPGVTEYVPRLFAIHEDLGVVEKECISGRRPKWSEESELFDLHQDIRKKMIPYGWTAPEFKTSSWIIDEDDRPILVDHSMANRIGHHFIEYLYEILMGYRPLPVSITPSFAAGLIESDVTSGWIGQDQAEDMIELLKSVDRWEDLVP